MKTQVGKLPLSDDDALLASALKARGMAAYGCRVYGPASLNNSQVLMQKCCQAVSNKTDQLRAEGYRMWMFMAGASMLPEQRAKYPTYDLAMPARREALLGEVGRTSEFREHGRSRTAGLFSILDQRFCDACSFLSRNSWCMGVLSRRRNFADEPGLDGLFRTAGFEADGVPHPQTNFLAAGTIVCPLGDVIVKTVGSFDDKDRGLMLVYDPTNPVGVILSSTDKAA